MNSVPTPAGHSGSRTDLRVLEHEIEAFEAAYARDLGAILRILSATELLRDSARAARAAYQEARDRAAADHDAIRRELHRRQDGLGASLSDRVPAYLLVSEQRREEAAAARLADAEALLAPVRARAAELDAEFSVLAERLDTLRAERDPHVSALRQRRREALLVTTAGPPPATQPPAPAFLGASPPALLTPPPEQPSKEELKALRLRIRRDEWEDLPAYHGSGDLPQRECLHCGAAVAEEHRRFCSRECHEMHLNAYGSPTRPRRRRAT